MNLEADETSGKPDERLYEMLTRIERKLDHLKDGLSLAGIKPCSWCGRFFQSADGGALLVLGEELICLDSVQEWWPRQSGQLSVKERELAEHKLVNWLLRHHRAKILPQTAEHAEDPLQELRLTAACIECSGAGTLLEKRCGYCDGRGTVWVITPRNGVSMSRP